MMSGGLNLSDSSQPPGFPELGVIDIQAVSFVPHGTKPRA
jgi:hypothetical protein